MEKSDRYFGHPVDFTYGNCFFVFDSDNKIIETIQELLQTCDALFLATVDSTETPMASFAPCWRDSQGYFYVMLSDLAEHTENLRNRPDASCLVLGPASDDAFSRPRVTLKLRAEFLNDTDSGYQAAVQGLTRKHGETMEILRGLADFHLIRLQPVSGTLIGGFATTLAISPDTTPELVPS